MFTGIIEAFGIIGSINRQGTNATFRISSPISNELKVDQSVSHNGVCLTVEDVKEGVHSVTAIEETLKKTNLLAWEEGTLVNLERCMMMNGRIDGHIVQGHVDTTARCTGKKDADGSWEYRFQFPQQFSALVIEKGSVSLNGISLTVFDVDDSSFSVAIIPYTYSHTNIQQVKEGSTVNIEFDMIGKYVNRMLALPK
ncbi:MAG TPA: riboflavin synthase [Segetibacter sp.]|nr:riboflavin synthase [Segetibacter sp.]